MKLSRSVSVRIAVVTAVGVVALGATGCGSSSSSSSSSASSGAGSSSASTTSASADASGGVTAAARVVAQLSKPQPLHVTALPKAPAKGVSVAFVACTLPNCYPSEGPKAAAVLGWKSHVFSYSLSQGPSNLATQLAAAIASKPRYISVISPYPLPTFASQLAAAKKAGIPVVAVTGNLTASDGVAGCFGCAPNLTKSGRDLADLVIARSGGKGQVAFVSDPTVVPLSQVQAGFAQQMKASAPGQQVNQVTISLLKPPSANISTVIAFLQSHPDVHYVVGAASSIWPGFADALKSAGLTSHVKIAVDGPLAYDVPLLQSGEEIGASASENQMNQWRAVDLMARLSLGLNPANALRFPVGWHQLYLPATANLIKGGAPQPPDFEQLFAKAWKVG